MGGPERERQRERETERGGGGGGGGGGGKSYGVGLAFDVFNFVHMEQRLSSRSCLFVIRAPYREREREREREVERGGRGCYVRARA